MRSLTLEPIRLPDGDPPAPAFVYDAVGNLLRIVPARGREDVKTRQACKRHQRIGCHAPSCVERERNVRRLR